MEIDYLVGMLRMWLAEGCWPEFSNDDEGHRRAAYDDDLVRAICAAEEAGLNAAPLIRLRNRMGDATTVLGEAVVTLEALVVRLEVRERNAESPPASVETPITRPEPEGPTLRREERALGLLAAHPDWTDTQIAKAIGVHRTTLYKPAWRKYRAARAISRGGRGELPRGEKDAETGRVEAWD